MALTDLVRVTLNKKAVLNQYPELVIKCVYSEEDLFEDDLEYGEDTIRIEPPLNRVFHTFPGGATLLYLGNNIWQIEASIYNPKAISEAIGLLTPIASHVS
jgi:hypothetical protein